MSKEPIEETKAELKEELKETKAELQEPKSPTFQTLTDMVKVDIPTRKDEAGEHVVSINYQKYLAKYWLPVLTAILFILQNDLGWKASVVLLIKTIIDYSWGSGTDMRAPGTKSRGSDDPSGTRLNRKGE